MKDISQVNMDMIIWNIALSYNKYYTKNQVSFGTRFKNIK